MLNYKLASESLASVGHIAMRQTAGSDQLNECYLALIGEADADTCCKRICVIIRRMQDDPGCSDHERHFVVLANQLVSETKTFGQYIVELDAYIKRSEYATALLIGKAMVRHEAMLHEIAIGMPHQYVSTIN